MHICDCSDYTHKQKKQCLCRSKPLSSLQWFHSTFRHSRLLCELWSFPVSVRLIKPCSVHYGLSQAANAMFSGQKLCILISASLHFLSSSSSSSQVWSCPEECFTKLSPSHSSTYCCFLLSNAKCLSSRRGDLIGCYDRPGQLVLKHISGSGKALVICSCQDQTK